MKTFLASLIIGSASLAGGVAVAAPHPTVSKFKNPNIHDAQKLIDKAFEKIKKAQVANEFDLDGHAQKAKDLLEQANAELKLAADAANAPK